jgi:hypothetical protein
MAAVAVMYETPTKFARYTVADGTGIPKGTILKLTTPNTAIATGADNDPVAGIAMFEKVASDGTTEITAALNGVWGITTSAAAITVGEDVTMNGANEIKKYTTLDNEKGYVLGKALETIGASATVIKVRVNVL